MKTFLLYKVKFIKKSKLDERPSLISIIDVGTIEFLSKKSIKSVLASSSKN